MKRFFTNTGLWLLAMIAVTAVLLCLMSVFGSGLFRSVFGAVAKPFRAAGTAVVEWVDTLSARFDSVEDLQAENETLRQQIAALEQQVRDYQTDSAENDRLRELLSLREHRTDLTLADANVIESSVSNWFSVLTLKRGTAQGIAVGNCAIDAYGNLVGVVTEAGKNWCTVTTALDTSSEIGALIFRTETPAVAKGSFSLMTENRLMLTYLSDEELPLNGDLIVTSGLGGYYPSGITIGTVESLHTDDSGMSRYAVVRPGTDLHSLKQVFVVTAFTEGGG